MSSQQFHDHAGAEPSTDPQEFLHYGKKLYL